MSSSQHKNGCSRCGRCCREVFFLVDKAYTEDGLDHQEWVRYHGLKIAYRDDAEGRRLWGIELDAPCRHLRDDGGGKAACAIYESRPGMCRNYTGQGEFPGCGYNKSV